MTGVLQLGTYLPQPFPSGQPPTHNTHSISHYLSLAGDWNGAGGHVNYSNNATRAAGTGWDAIQEQIAKLEKRHAYHIAQYGEVSTLAGYLCW